MTSTELCGPPPAAVPVPHPHGSELKGTEVMKKCGEIWRATDKETKQVCGAWHWMVGLGHLAVPLRDGGTRWMGPLSPVKLVSWA